MLDNKAGLPSPEKSPLLKPLDFQNDLLMATLRYNEGVINCPKVCADGPSRLQDSN